MIFILLSIFTTSLIIIQFKLFNYFKVNTFLAIVVNYLIAAIFGFLVTPNVPPIEQMANQTWFPICLVVGILFIISFQAMAVCTQKLGISVSTVAGKMSVTIPVIGAFLLYGDTINSVKIIGLVLAVIAVVLTSLKNKDNASDSTFLQKVTLPTIVFVGSGSIDLFINYVQNNYVNSIYSSQLLLSIIFTGSFIIGLFVLIYKSVTSKIEIDLKSILFGVVLGILNYLCIIFLMKAIETNILQASVLYPINNMSVVMVTSAVGYFFFKEKISFINLLGIILAVIAILLIMIS